MAAGARIPRPADSLPGAPAPWYQVPEERRTGISIDEVQLALTAARGSGEGSPARPAWERVTPAELPSGKDSRPAAVLCLLFERGGEANVVLTRRSAHLRSHSGEVSFPGGRLHSGELPLQAALREANEEIGVDAGSVDVIGQLTPLTTVRSPALVHCFVGRLRTVGPGSPGSPGSAESPGRPVFASDPREVEKVFWVPLASLAREGVYHEELWPALEDQGRTTYRAVPFFRLEDDIVWGATGRLLTELIDAVLAQRTEPKPEGRSGLSGRYPGGA
jgi:8-oxo-dGTP pyrophosphatase MutT (NUDIX family)